jgi:hypothetical protein
MNCQLWVCAFACVAIFSLVDGRPATAGDYVWARTNWGASNISRPYSSMSNGYGGYYVPRNAYGNNFEGQRFTNPNGFVVPGGAVNYPVTRRRFR